MNTETGEFKEWPDPRNAYEGSNQKKKKKYKQWIRFDLGETVNVKGQDFLIDGVDFVHHKLILVSKKFATNKEGLEEMMTRVQEQAHGPI